MLRVWFTYQPSEFNEGIVSGSGIVLGYINAAQVNETGHGIAIIREDDHSIEEISLKDIHNSQWEDVK